MSMILSAGQLPCLRFKYMRLWAISYSNAHAHAYIIATGDHKRHSLSVIHIFNACFVEVRSQVLWYHTMIIYKWNRNVASNYLYKSEEAQRNRVELENIFILFRLLFVMSIMYGHFLSDKKPIIVDMDSFFCVASDLSI